MAAAAAAYLVAPVDLVPNKVPVVGMLDDLGMLAVALRKLLGAAGYEVVTSCGGGRTRVSHSFWRSGAWNGSRVAA